MSMNTIDKLVCFGFAMMLISGSIVMLVAAVSISIDIYRSFLGH